jgi:putative ABC transport system ATP-binding protein
LTAKILVQTKGLEKVYNSGMPDELTALHDVSIEIIRNKVTVLKGPSGSGKTSLLSLIGCMSRPTAGQIYIDKKDVGKLPERFLTNIRREKFGFIFQQLHLIRNVSVLENILLPLYPLSMAPIRMQEKAISVMKKFGIEDKKNFKVKQLSGGEQQRVAIARAMINDPKIIIADEPTAHLDSKLASEFMELLESLLAEGKTIIIATHDLFVHEHLLVNKTIVMKDGRIEKVETR